MDIGPLVLANASSKSSSSDGESMLVKLKNMLQRITRRPHPHRSDEECSECERQQDERLHELATRIHVLEWEAYGHDAAKRKRKEP